MSIEIIRGAIGSGKSSYILESIKKKMKESDRKNVIIVPEQFSYAVEKLVVEKFGGVCYPAHIDRSSNGIIAVLGTLPPTPHFNVVELKDRDKFDRLKAEHGLDGRYFVYSSDAHSLEMMSDAQNFVELPDGLSGKEIAKALVDFFKNPNGGRNEGIIS